MYFRYFMHGLIGTKKMHQSGIFVGSLSKQATLFLSLCVYILIEIKKKGESGTFIYSLFKYNYICEI